MAQGFQLLGKGIILSDPMKFHVEITKPSQTDSETIRSNHCVNIFNE